MDATSSLEGFVIGMGIMLTFGLGTIPALLLVAKLADLGWVRSRQVIYKIGSVLMVIVGVHFLVKGIQY
jgi:sulfite exporter TauE/SafE